MTKEHKQLILVAVLSVTLYAVWPSRPEKDNNSTSVNTHRSSEGATIDTESVRLVSLSENDPSHEKSAITSPNKPVRRRWELGEILQMGHSRPKQSASRQSRKTGGLEAIYFTSSPGRSQASAIIGGKVVKPGESLQGNRVVREIKRDGIAIELAK